MKALTAVLKFLAGILAPIIRAVTAGLLDELKEIVIKFREKAAQTENPWDDMLADVICTLLGID